MAATPAPLFFKPQVPVTPPPDQHTFNKGPSFPPQPPRSDFARVAYAAMGMKPPQEQPGMSAPPPSSQTETTATPASAGSGLPNGVHTNFQELTSDPRYLAMASRIASYYQQRCQAISNFQQQRCQAWANAQRAKCQEMMQAAMLIVAWYIRDRISRRRKRQRRAFKRGLRQRSRPETGNKITKGESVRRWVLDVPLKPTSSPRADADEEKRALDKDEAAFEMDKDEPAPDKDSQLFNVADSMIKSQLARIDVPLLGVLSLDESDDESDSDTDEEFEEDFQQEGGDEEMEDGEEEEDYDEEDGEYESEVQTPEVEVAGSKSVHLGTLKDNSRNPNGSSCVS
ncbi:hypothetical protein QBC47DRAFT_214673 [Echria macrotheca]|uniref:Uncharacterized protein n=1 Tax=Echria macrotheca TaxID=438768 RepID=A0AAJ0FBP1_9PEZI|nr:hypothetical protein QBC47DRAFT_214673 [Echria macrotheca]